MGLAPPSPRPTDEPTGARLSGARQRYRSDGAPVSSPARVVVMLYERLARDITDADRALLRGDRPAAHSALVHAQEIIDALDLSLDVGRWDGGPSLRSIYEHLNRELVEANVRGDRSRLVACLGIVEPLLDAWRQAWATTAEGSAGVTGHRTTTTDETSP